MHRTFVKLVFFPHIFAAFLCSGGRPAIMPLCYLVTKQLSGFCSHIPSDWACYKIPRHPVWIKKQQPGELKLLVMIFSDWLVGGEELWCLEEDQTISLSRGPTFNYIYIYKIHTSRIAAAVASKLQTESTFLLENVQDNFSNMIKALIYHFSTDTSTAFSIILTFLLFLYVRVCMYVHDEYMSKRSIQFWPKWLLIFGNWSHRWHFYPILLLSISGA